MCPICTFGHHFSWFRHNFCVFLRQSVVAVWLGATGQQKVSLLPDQDLSFWLWANRPDSTAVLRLGICAVTEQCFRLTALFTHTCNISIRLWLDIRGHFTVHCPELSDWALRDASDRHSRFISCLHKIFKDVACERISIPATEIKSKDETLLSVINRSWTSSSKLTFKFLLDTFFNLFFSDKINKKYRKTKIDHLLLLINFVFFVVVLCEMLMNSWWFSMLCSAWTQLWKSGWNWISLTATQIKKIEEDFSFC